MDNQFDNNFTNDIAPSPARPQFLKVLCIITFVWSGILILVYLIGSMALLIGEETASLVAEKAMESNPMLQIENPSEFIHQIGTVSLLNLLANIASLVGAIMMWNLNRVGFFVYAIAEIAANFFGLNVNAGVQEKSYGMLIFVILIDIAFIVMYALNLKYMNKNKASVIS